MLAFILACSRPPPPPDLPAGSWLLEAEEARGSLRIEADDCRIALNGGSWGTRGEVRCHAHASEDWMVFPVTTALGEADAVARWEDEALVVPLGAREGEFEVRLRRHPGSGASEGVDAVALASEQAAWEAGVFHLEGAFAGELDLLRWTAELAGPRIWTDQPELVELQEQGMDLILLVPAEPALGTASTRLRINRVLRQGVLPVAEQPTEQDLAFSLVPGTWSTRETDRAAARQAALEAERSRLEQLAAELRPGLSGPCPEALPDGLSQALWGYAARFEAADTGCALVLDPDPPQHGRYLSVRIEPSGIVQSLERD